MRSSTAPASKTAWGRRVAPAIRQVRMQVLVPEAVKEGQHHQVAIALPQTHRIGPVEEGAERLGVRAGDALGAAGRARGEEDVGEIVGAHRERPRLGSSAGDLVGAGEVRFPGDCPGGAAPRRTTIGPSLGRETPLSRSMAT